MDELRYVVRGRWPFPLDMLRSDQARAATGADQSLIDELSGTFAPNRDAIRDRVEIGLVMPRRRRFEQPNIKRWESFGWRVVSIDGERLQVVEPPPRDDRTEARELLVRLQEWATRMGGFEAEVWADVRAFLDRTRKD